MPKIIKNLQEDILAESIKIIDDGSMGALSIRTISKRLGIAPSTIYNYYRSKDEIIGAVMMLRWNEILKKIDEECFRGDMDTIDILSMIVANLRMSVRPLLLSHADSANTVNNKFGHIHKHKQTIFYQLRERVKLILDSNKNIYSDSEIMSNVITKLLIMCIHDDELEFKELIATVKKL